MDSVRIVEAVLFSSPQPLRVAEIADEVDLSRSAVRRAIKKLKEELEERGSAIEVFKTGPAYSLQLREKYTDCGRPFAEKEVPEDVLKTAAMIAYHQPILQSDLAKMLGSKVYDHVRTLNSMGLIYVRKKGQTLKLATTKKFSEYFGIESTKKEDIKRWMESRIKG